MHGTDQKFTYKLKTKKYYALADAVLELNNIEMVEGFLIACKITLSKEEYEELKDNLLGDYEGEE